MGRMKYVRVIDTCHDQESYDGFIDISGLERAFHKVLDGRVVTQLEWKAEGMGFLGSMGRTMVVEKVDLEEWFGSANKNRASESKQ